MPRKRRSFSATVKSKVALDAIKGLKTVAEIAKLHQVHTSQVVLWKRQVLEGVESVFDGPTDRKDKAADQPQTAELYEQIGKLNMQLEWIESVQRRSKNSALSGLRGRFLRSYFFLRNSLRARRLAA